MPVPYISLYIPTRPLLIWTLVTGGCGLLLAIEALILAVRGMGGALVRPCPIGRRYSRIGAS